MEKTATKTPIGELQRLEKRRRCAGSSIVESLMALIVFALFIAGASRMMVNHRQMSDMARGHYTAVNIAKNRLELVRSFQFGQVSNFLENKVLVDASGLPDPEGSYRRTTEVASQSGNLLELAVTVEIRNRKTMGFEGANEHLTTFFAEYLTENSSVGGGVAPNSSS
jgi:hypothetical protein